MLPERLRVGSAKKVFLQIFKVLLIILPPFFLLQGLNDFYAVEQISREQDRQRQEMLQILGDIAGMAEPQPRFSKVFRELSNIAFPSETFFTRLQQILRQHEDAFEIYFYDKAGKCLDVDFLPRAPKFVAQKFLAAVLDPSKAENQQKWLSRFSGYSNAHLALANSYQTITRIGRSDDRQWGGVFNLQNKQGKPGGYLIVFIKKSKIEAQGLLNQSVFQASRRHARNYFFAWLDPNSPDTVNSQNFPDGEYIIEKALNLPFGESRFLVNKRQGIKSFTHSGFIIVALARHSIKRFNFYRYVDFSLKLLAGLTFVVLFPVFMGWTINRTGLRGKLVAVLLLGSGISVVALLFTGIIDRADREKVLTNQYQNENIEALRRIDEGMLFEYKRLETIIKGKIAKLAGKSDSEFYREIEGFWGSFAQLADRFKEMAIVSPQKSFLFRPGEGLAEMGNIESSVTMYGEMILKTYMGEFLTPERSATSTSFKDVIYNSSSTFARNFILKGGNFEVLNLADNKVPTYIDFFLDAENQGRAIILALLSRAGLQRNYLYDVSRQFDVNHGQKTERFVAVPLNAGRDWPAFPKRKSAQHAVLKELAIKAASNALPVHENAVISGRKYLLSALRGNNLDGYVLILARPYSLIADRLQVLNKSILILALSVVGLACLLGWLTSSLLLKPIGRFARILTEIASGNFRVRLDREKVAEFDEVASTLNKTLESFQELKVASSVQENLWPESGLEGEDWELEGVCKTASELGGDHYDWYRLSDGRILVVIGDVTGHGVASAMVQASVKVWLAMKAEKFSNAADLLRQINSLHCRFGAKKLPMSCWVGYYSPATGALNFSSAGQSYPLLVDEHGQVEPLKIPGMPMGIREKARYSNNEIILAPGQSLFLYTDGIVEISNAAQQMFGFERLEALVADIASLSAKDAIEHVFATARAWGEPNDDQTIIILKRFRRRAL